MILTRLSETLQHKPDMSEAKWNYAMLARDFAAAEKILLDRPAVEFPAFEPTPWFRACLALAQGDREGARGFLEEIKPLYENKKQEHPDEPVFHSSLGKLYALLGQKEEAIREARRAVELCPESKDAVAGPPYAANLAWVYAQTGEIDQAVTLLSHLLTTPAADKVTLAHLRLSWEWDPLRNDSHFQALLAGPEPADGLQIANGVACLQS